MPKRLWIVSKINCFSPLILVWATPTSEEMSNVLRVEVRNLGYHDLFCEEHYDCFTSKASIYSNDYLYFIYLFMNSYAYIVFFVLLFTNNSAVLRYTRKSGH